MAILFVDLENGDDNYSGTSFAPLASGVDGRITLGTAYTFSSATANFANDGSITQAKNLFGAAESVDNANAFAAFDIIRTLVTNQTSPISGSNVYTIVESAINATHRLAPQSITFSLNTSVQYTVSYYVKSFGRYIVTMRFGALNSKGARFNLNTGTVEAVGASATAAISDAGNGWYRISLTATPLASNELIELGLTDNNYSDTGMETYTGNGIDGIYVSAPQLEQSSAVTTYEKPTEQYLSIWTGSQYSVYKLIYRLNSTTFTVVALSGGTALSSQAVDRQYYIGGRWKNINLTNTAVGASAVRLTPGDTIRIMGSPAPTLVGSGVWTSERMGTALNILSSTNSSPITVNLNAASMSSLGLNTGDTITIAGHTTNTNANGTWIITVANPALAQMTLNGSTGNGVGGATGQARKRTNSVVTLSSPVTANIASFGNRGEGRTAWTAVTNVTAALDATDTKEGDVSDSIAIGAAFVTGKAAYKATGTLDLSGYQQLSFWIKQTAGTVAVNGDISLRLCSDTLGNTTVHTFNIEGLGALNQWTCLVVNLGSNMNNSIQSIALYVDADKGAQTFLLSNIIACKASSSADSLNLTSLVGKNTTDEAWFPIMSINGTRLILGSYTNMTPLLNPTSTIDSFRGYYGTSGTFDVYKRETIKAPIGLSVNTPQIIRVPEGGTAAAPFNYEGGWDRTNMSVQNLETYIDGKNGLGIGLYNDFSYINIKKIGVTRFYSGSAFGSSSFFLNLSLEWAVGCQLFGWVFSSMQRSVINYAYACGNGTGGIGHSTIGTPISKNTFNNLICVGTSVGQGIVDTNFINNTYNTVKLYNNSRAGLEFRDCTNNTFNNLISESNGLFGINFYSSYKNQFNNLLTNNNGSGGVSIINGELLLYNSTINESTEFSVGSNTNGRICSTNHDNTTNNYIIATDYGTIRPQVAVRYSNSGFAWALSPTNSTYRTSDYPLDLAIATIAVNANSLVTVKAWMRRTNAALTTGLRIKGGQIAGVPNDVTSYMTAAADTWQQVTLTFTPTEVGVVEILAECYGGTTHTAYVDDISVTQV